MAYYPIFLDMQDKSCLVIGGGRVAEGKVAGLLAAGAKITVIAPELSAELSDLQAQGTIAVETRPYREGDMKSFDLCFVATDDGAVNAAVAAEGRSLGIWVNAADDPANCDFILPSVVRRGQVVIAASTGGASPALARKLREELSEVIGEEYGPLAELLSEVRRQLKQRNLAVDAEVWNRAIDNTLKEALRAGRLTEARDHLLQALGVAQQLSGGGR